MKKLFFLLLLSVIVMNINAMDHTEVELAKQDVAKIKAFTYPLAAIIITGWGGYHVFCMWSDYCDYLEKRQQHQGTSSGATMPHYQSSWAPYAKIALGTGLLTLGALRGNGQNQVMSHSNKNEGIFNIAPTLMIGGSPAAWAAMIGGGILLKSGCDDLTVERKALLKYQNTQK